jgi:hypothetical protein
MVPLAVQHFDIVFSPEDQQLTAMPNVSPSKDKVDRLKNGSVEVKDVQGIHAKVTRSVGGYEVTSGELQTVNGLA